jgi:Protein of unknown function (DUF3106)
VGQRVFRVTTAFIAVALVAATVLASGSLAHAGTEATQLPPVPWKKVPDTEKKILNPLQKDWDQLPSGQQRKLIGAAKTYPKLAPIQQERFQERIKEWSTLTPAQRHAARDKYKNLSSLPPEKQHVLRERWNEKSAAQSGVSQAPASATDSTAAAK